MLRHSMSSLIKDDTPLETIEQFYKSKLSVTEQHFVDHVQVEKLRGFLNMYASKPHTCGTSNDYETALRTAEQFKSFGLDTEIMTYYTLLSYPISRRLSLQTSPTLFRELNLTEGSVFGDACTTDQAGMPPFLAYSPSGNVTATVVYANYGRREDFEWLKANNVSLERKIALIRLGGNIFRGLKVMSSVEFQLAGVLLYSDPQDDGFVQGSVYPDGPWRPEDSFQRGSVYVECGDPLTPGWASIAGTKYLKYDDVQTIPHIPALPLSYGQAKLIFEKMGGQQAPASWQGGLVMMKNYCIGDDEATIMNLDVKMNNTIGPIWNVIGTIHGSDAPDELVILGNHRDAWVCGAVDPGSGSSALLELARGFGMLLEQGWRPHLVEDNAEVLKKQAVAYVNVDTAVGEIISADGSPSISRLLMQAAKDIPANQFFGNETENNLFEQWFLQSKSKVGVLGSSSDFAAFIEHLGVTSANIRFKLSREHEYGAYHSSMDSIAYSEKFADPNHSRIYNTLVGNGCTSTRGQCCDTNGLYVLCVDYE
ncbi:unnamed protein product [Phytophthora fragariaefolia]|uniref:Unnamed protein product n=1 Tax=Phytophthora fragariaefolia TaxID=1490495 RepID=A0A9W6XZS1_9STRA|nr:unnamed protein product [Phytophthora fragariaefolia]